MRALLDRFGLRPRKRLSQNFLVDPRIAERIAQAVDAGPRTRVIEIGPGLGALTLSLAARAKELVAVEKDPAMASALSWVLESHGLALAPRGPLAVIVADVLTLDLDRLAGGQAVWVGNLPYHVTSPLLLGIICSRTWRQAVLMVQREVAERLIATPGSEAYGSLTVAVSARGRVRRLFEVSRRVFFPAPDVDSTVIEIVPLASPPPPPLSRALEDLLRAGFGQRRKTLRNALRTLRRSRVEGVPAGEAGIRAEEIEELLGRAGLDGGRRAETLSPQEFLELARAWQERSGGVN